MNRREFLLAGTGVLLGCREARETPALANLEHGQTAFASAVTTPAAQAAPILGINSHHLLDADLALIRELGINHIRSTLYTPLWTDNPGYRAAAIEHTARTAGAGMELMYVVHNAYGDVFRMGNDPGAARDLAGVMADMVASLPRVEAWQLWNEQDVWVQAPFGAGAIPRASAARVGEIYGRWWAEAYARLKGINPEARIVTGAPADHADERWEGFLRGFADSRAEADAIGIHVYGSWSRARARLLAAREIAGAGQPLWLTECGAPPGPDWSQSSQFEAWRSVIEGNGRERIADRVYPYALQTDPNDPWFGVTNVDGSPRPVLDWLRSRARNR